ncbi:MAG: STAS domain-containing protein [Phycisphaerales bacterium]
MRHEVTDAASHDGIITVQGMDQVALIFLNIPAIREGQAAEVRQRIERVADVAKGRVAVSMADVQEMTSAGINALVAAHQRCVTLGAHLALFALSKELARLIRITKLDRSIVVAADVREAVRSFESRSRTLFGIPLGRARPRSDAA